MRIPFSLVFSALIVSISMAQEMKVREGVSGNWILPGDTGSRFNNWQAHWIWLPAGRESDKMLARKTFDAPATISKAQLRIAASSQYKLYINGEYICHGPSRSAPHHQSFDILDVTSLIRNGLNTIAIEVHYQAGKFSYHHHGRAGLLVQLDGVADRNGAPIISDNSWKVIGDPSWDNTAPKISRFQLVVNDRVDLRKAIPNWLTTEFDDSQWFNAESLMRNVGWPSPQKNARPQALTPPWISLVPRDLPYLRETIEMPLEFVLLNEGSQKPTSLIISRSDTADSRIILYDLGRVINGFPMLDIEGPRGTVVEILSAPFMVDNQFTHQVVDSDFRDVITLSGNRDHWESTYFKPIRHLGLIIHNKKKSVRLHSVAIRGLDYPFERRGKIHSTDADWVGRYMEASEKTILACTTDAYTDNYRERRQYAQTGFYAALGNYWTFGDWALQRRYLVQVALEQQANGIMPAYAPLASDDYMIILDSNCLWIRSLRNYFLFSGDVITIRQLLPAATRLMALLHGFTNSLGLLDDPPYAYWMDHALNDRRGANFCLNGHYLGALEDFAQTLDWLEVPGQERYRDRADLLRQSLAKNFWNPQRRLFADALIDRDQSDQFSEHANAMALALGIATAEQADQIADQLLVNDHHNFIKRASGTTVVTPAMSYFLHKGLCDYGYVRESLQMFRDRFDQMLTPESNGTLWEEWWLNGTGRSGEFKGGRTRSDAQTESAFPPDLFATYLLGIEPVQPGLKEVRIHRIESGVREIRGLVPTLEGDLIVEWKKEPDGSGSLLLDVPGDMVVKIDREMVGLSMDTSEENIVILKRGRHQLEFKSVR